MKKKSLRPLARVLVEHLAPVTGAPQIATTLQEVVQTMHRCGLGARVRELEAEIGKAWRDVLGAEQVTVTSAHRLSEAALQELEKRANGASVRVVIDGRLIGGATVRIDDVRLDGSVGGQVARLRRSLVA